MISLSCIGRRWKFMSTYFERWTLQHFYRFSNVADMRMLIYNNTVISRNHMTPEIALHLITSACPLWKARPESCPFPDPFWAFYWPGGQAMTRFILDNPDLVRGLSVIDIGSGSGASAIAASKCGAKLAIANDVDPVAGIVAEMNAALNGTKVLISSDDHIKEEDAVWDISKDDVPWDVIILGDLFYDADMSERVMTWAKRCSDLGVLVMIGDPGRYTFSVEAKIQSCFGIGDAGTTNSFLPHLCLLKCYPLPKDSCLENNGFSHASVWKICGNHEFCHISCR